MTRLAVFASGTGTNTANILHYFAGHPAVCVACVATDNPTAPVAALARQANVPVQAFSRAAFRDGTSVTGWLRGHRVDWIALAGFLTLLPESLIRVYPGRIVNLHPALLPDFGGQGMYGLRVHRAVLAAGSRESGITVHLVNERYDEGKIVFQARVPVTPGETEFTLQEKVRKLELEHYPRVIEKLITSQ